MNKPLVLITGASGFIGSRLVTHLLKQDYQVVGLTRQKNKVPHHPCLQWISDLNDLKTDQIDYVINLAGESIGKGRWTDDRKEQLLQSRIKTTEQLYQYLNKRNIQPKRIVSGSAVGYYGIDVEEKWGDVCTEASSSQEIFMSELCQKWEAVTQQYPEQNTKIIRLGVVFSMGGGILPQMLLPIRFNLVGRIGTGMQPCVWIHIDDVISAIEFLIEKDTTAQIFNLVAPESESKVFCRIGCTYLKEKTFIYIASFYYEMDIGRAISIDIKWAIYTA